MSDSKHCKYCEEAFDEEEGISESVTTPGVCEYCEQNDPVILLEKPNPNK